MQVLIMFRSLTYAQKGSRVLERAGIPASVTKAPQGTTDQGCTYCVRIRQANLSAALRLLDESGLSRGRILFSTASGEYREALL